MGLCGGYGPSSQGFIYVYHIMSPVVFFLAENGWPSSIFLKEIPKRGLLALSALLGCKSFKTRRDVSSKKWACPENGL